jgi:hypothetical protein
MDLAIRSRAAFVLAPCCVGRLGVPSATNAVHALPRSAAVRAVLTEEDMRALAKVP